MGRGKVQMKKIENRINRQVTFSKRKTGLFKKAQELSVLCDAEVAVIIYSSSGKLYEYANNSMESTIQKHEEIHGEKMQHEKPFTNPMFKNLKYWQEEAIKLRQIMDNLNISIRQLKGEALQLLSITDLQQLEIRLEKGLGCIRSKKEEKLFEEIDNLQRRQYLLQVDNQFLTTKNLQEMNSIQSQAVHQRE